MKFTLSALLLGTVGLATMVLAGNFVPNGDEAFVVTSVPGGAYYVAGVGADACTGKLSDAGSGYLFDLATKNANDETKDKGEGSAHVFNTGMTTTIAGRAWKIDIAAALPYNWATSYIYFLSGSRSGKNEYKLQNIKRAMPGGTLACNCGACKDDPAFNTNSVVATYANQYILVVPA